MAGGLGGPDIRSFPNLGGPTIDYFTSELPGSLREVLVLGESLVV